MIPRKYECTIKNYFGEGKHLSEIVIERSASKARYYFYLKLDHDYPYNKLFRYISVKSYGKSKTSDWFGDSEMFKRICKSRNIEFAYQGMSIDVDGQKGIIVGGNSHNNLDVLMDGKMHIENCHPSWETTFYNKEMNIVKDFKKVNA